MSISNHLEKKQEILFCIFSVFFLLLLLCGDFLITKFIPVNPNQEYFLQEKSCREISLEEAISYIQKEEELYLFFGDKNDHQKEQCDLVSNLYFVDSSLLEKEEIWQEFLKTLDFEFPSFSIPKIVFFQNGIYKKSFDSFELLAKEK